MVVDLSQNSYCLSINPEKYSRLCEWFRTVGIKPPVCVKGIVHPDHRTACTVGHISIIREAISKNLPYVCVFEDDAYPHPEVSRLFNDLMRECLDNNIEWGTFVLGRNGEASGWHGPLTREFHLGLTPDSKQFHTRGGFTSDVLSLSDNIIKIPRHLFGAHAYIVKQAYFNHAIQRFDKCDIFADTSLCYDKLHTVCSRECLFVQKNDDGTYYYPEYYDQNRMGYIGTHDSPPASYGVQ